MRKRGISSHREMSRVVPQVLRKSTVDYISSLPAAAFRCRLDFYQWYIVLGFKRGPFVTSRLRSVRLL